MDSEKNNTQKTRSERRVEPRDKYTWRYQLKRLPLLLLIPIGIFLPRLVQNAPDKVERIYSRGIYPLVSRLLGFFSSLVPASLAEILLIGLGGLLLAVFVIRLLKIPFGKLRSRRENRIRFYSFLMTLGVIAGVMLNLFYLLWGFNHYRRPLSALMELDVHTRSVEELAVLTEHLAREAAELRERVAEDENGVFSAKDRADALQAVSSAYRELGRDNELFSNKCYRAKTPFFSKTLSKLNIAGIYIPYLAEPNVNAEQPDLYFLSGAAHEMGHYFGFAAEEEANFIAYYVSLWSEDDAVRYSCVMAALSSCANKLHSNDSEKYSEIWYSCYSEGMQRDLANYREYYQAYEDHPAAQVNNNINDAYLQYHGHSDGLKSYGRDVDLLLALYEKGGMQRP
ncbi:MAG: DUF3810 domain-containing protein [Clostridia bacterium]|nr:DUF3810 domain-containing protein [Clostridia bacterium]